MVALNILLDDRIFNNTLGGCTAVILSNDYYGIRSFSKSKKQGQHKC